MTHETIWTETETRR